MTIYNLAAVDYLRHPSLIMKIRLYLNVRSGGSEAPEIALRVYHNSIDSANVVAESQGRIKLTFCGQAGPGSVKSAAAMRTSYLNEGSYSAR